MKKKILISIGTRPEIIKTAVIIKKLKEEDAIMPVVLSTGQHSSMLDDMLKYFDITPDYKLNVMKKNQSLTYLSAKILTEIEKIIEKEKPDMVMVQGDTTTAFFSALAAFYHKIPVAHIEAGLRTYKKYQPFPEEINRQFIDRISDLMFAPTKQNYQNLIKENLNKDKIFITGNTVIDALNLIAKDYNDNSNEKIVLITAHRRENFGEGIKNICNAIKRLAQANENIKFVYPVHKNPNIQKPVNEILSDIPNVVLTQPLNYPEFISYLMKSVLVLTDSGGVQEEAVSLGIPTIVLRNVTERREGVDANILIPVGTNEQKIYDTALDFIRKNVKCQPKNVFGKGDASEKIIKIIKEKLYVQR